MTNNKEHWDYIYQHKNEAERSWFQAYPQTSVSLIESCHLSSDAPVLDVGGGDSHLVDALLEKGFTNIWVLDISGQALERAKIRLGRKAQLVHWVSRSILEFEPSIKFELWHDRATFHFLTDEDEITRYITLAGESITGNGNLILSTFSNEGPLKCSGLDVHQYSEELLSEKFSGRFQKISCLTENHITPFDTLQNFLYCKFRKMPYKRE